MVCLPLSMSHCRDQPQQAAQKFGSTYRSGLKEPKQTAPFHGWLRSWWWLADGIPILVRVIEHRNFHPGPFQLGRWHLPINLAAICWVVVSSVRPPSKLLPPLSCLDDVLFVI